MKGVLLHRVERREDAPPVGGGHPLKRFSCGPGGVRFERAIGVIYVPQTERRSHYFHARLPEQFDFVLHFDETRAVEPLERRAG